MRRGGLALWLQSCYLKNRRPVESLLYLQLHQGELTHPVSVLEEYFRGAGVTVIQAAFAHSYFVHPDSVKAKTPYFPDRARFSRQNYPGATKGQKAVWSGDGREVVVDDNQHAQMAWARYTGRGLARGTGYSVRHIWGHPWDPDAFTAGWNLCYMPFWAGMLTEKQHPHADLELAVRQASWDLYFRNKRVCEPPDYVEDPGLDLPTLLAGQPVLILGRDSRDETHRSRPSVHLPPRGADPVTPLGSIPERVKEIRTQTHQSWSNIRKAARSLQGLSHEPFGTSNVGNSAKSCVRKIHKETGLSFAEIESLLNEHGW